MGIIEDKENYSSATKDDILYMLNQIGEDLFSYRISETIIDEISNNQEIPFIPSKIKQLVK